MRQGRPAGRTGMGRLGERRGMVGEVLSRPWCQSQALDSTQQERRGGDTTSSGLEGIKDPCSLGGNPHQFISGKNKGRRGHTHLPENPFMVDAGFQVPFDGWTHGRLSLCTMLLICFQKLLKSWNNG